MTPVLYDFFTTSLRVFYELGDKLNDGSRVGNSQKGQGTIREVVVPSLRFRQLLDGDVKWDYVNKTKVH